MKWFTEDEVKGLSPSLVDMLDKAREIARVPFVITSGFRSPEHNAAVGGVANSAHTRGLAVDLRCQTSMARFLMVEALIASGFKRIVLYAGDGHIHTDLDETLPNPVLVVLP